MDDYAILGIAIGCTKEDMLKAFRKLAMIHHPDKGGDIEKFKKIVAARDRLVIRMDRPQYTPPHRNQEPFSGFSHEDFVRRTQYQSHSSQFYYTSYRWQQQNTDDLMKNANDAIDRLYEELKRQQEILRKEQQKHDRARRFMSGDFGNMAP